MTTTPPIITEAEALIRTLAAEMTSVRPGECLHCYLWRQVGEHGCDGTHRLALHYRDEVAPRATAIEQRLRRMGACCCDCELFMNGYQPHERFWTPQRETDDGWVIDAQEPDELPPCTGVRRGSVQPCEHWVRVRRGW